MVYVSEREGDDDAGDGTEQKPFKSVNRAFKEGDVRPRARAPKPSDRCATAVGRLLTPQAQRRRGATHAAWPARASLRRTFGWTASTVPAGRRVRSRVSAAVQPVQRAETLPEGKTGASVAKGRAPVANAAFKKQKKMYQTEKSKAEKAAAAAAKKVRLRLVVRLASA